MNQSQQGGNRYKRQGTDVPVDAFLHSCLEEEKALKARISQGKQEPILWPHLRFMSPKARIEEVKEVGFSDTVMDLTSWYAANKPELGTAATWDYENLSAVASGLVALASDLDFVHEIISGEARLPEFDARQDPWKTIMSQFEKLFAPKMHFHEIFLPWFYTRQDKASLIEEIGNRPPVGRFIPRPQRRPPQGQQQQGRGNGGGSQSSGGGGNSRRRPEPPKKEFHERQGRNPPMPDVEVEKEAIQACEEGIRELETNPEQKIVILKPQNSFYRRLQHQHIIQRGFQSKSTGDGKERSVAIVRE